MNREDAVLALLADANPAPDTSSFTINPSTRARLENIEHWSKSMQDTNLRSVESAPVPPPKVRRGLIFAVVTAVVILVVGFASFAWLTDDETPPATSEPTITFTGAECNYEGPSEFTLGVERSFTYVNQSDAEAAAAIFRVPNGTTIEDIDPNDVTAIFEGASGPRSFLSFGADDLAPGAEERFAASPSGAVPDEPGEWLVFCFVKDRDATTATPAGDRPGAIFSVTAP